MGIALAAGMANVLSVEKREQVIALGRLGWSLRRIEQATGVRRETAGAYLKVAGVAVRAPGQTGPPPKPATAVSTDPWPAGGKTGQGVSTDSDAPAAAPSPGRSPSASACEAYREVIEEALGHGRNAMAIWQDLVDRHAFAAGYASVMRYVRGLRRRAAPEACATITTAPGEEAQVDYGEGPMVRFPRRLERKVVAITASVPHRARPARARGAASDARRRARRDRERRADRARVHERGDDARRAAEIGRRSTGDTTAFRLTLADEAQRVKRAPSAM